MLAFSLIIEYIGNAQTKNLRRTYFHGPLALNSSNSWITSFPSMILGSLYFNRHSLYVLLNKNKFLYDFSWMASVENGKLVIPTRKVISFIFP